MKQIYLSFAACCGLILSTGLDAANSYLDPVSQNYYLTDPHETPQTNSPATNALPTRSYNNTPPPATVNMQPQINVPSSMNMATPTQNYGMQTYEIPPYGNPVMNGQGPAVYPQNIETQTYAPAPAFVSPTLDYQGYPNQYHANSNQGGNYVDNQIYTAPINPNINQGAYPQLGALSGNWQASPNTISGGDDWEHKFSCQQSYEPYRFTGQNSYDGCESTAPEDQELNDCYCLNVHYRPCYYYSTEVDYIPKYQYLRCCRYIPEYYNVTRCREETENYPVMRCKYVEEPYYLTRCRIIKEPYTVTRCKMHCEPYQETRYCYCEKYNPETCCKEPVLHQYQQTSYKDVPEYYEEQCFRDVPQYYQITCCRKVPQYYEVTCCRKVPRYYDETCCRYVPQYYYVVQCKYCPVYKYKKQCKYIPQYYYKHSGDCQKGSMVMAEGCYESQ